jgi:Uma2 family endonuclease
MPMAATKVWTLDDLHSLPEDGNKYELVDGELFVTPAPSVSHEAVLARLARVLDPYVTAHGLGYVLRPRAVIRRGGSEVEPDLMVRAIPDDNLAWDALPLPLLVVEVASPSTRRRNREQKRQFYSDVGVAEYWIADREKAAITVVRPGRADVEAVGLLTWGPEGAGAPLVIDVPWVLLGRAASPGRHP